MSIYYNFTFYTFLKYVSSHVHGGARDTVTFVFEYYPFVGIAFISLSAVSIALLVLLFLQLWNASINITTIENEKYKAMRKRTPSHFYNKGFFNNWAEVLFPVSPKSRNLKF